MEISFTAEVSELSCQYHTIVFFTEVAVNIRELFKIVQDSIERLNLFTSSVRYYLLGVSLSSVRG